jgi:hypothetical protein
MKTILTIFCLLLSQAFAENINPYKTGEQYAWSENTGWMNAEPSTGNGMQVQGDKLTGFFWSENIGWINLNCENNATCGAVSYGVVNDGAGNLSGYAWAENVGWINFDPDVPDDTSNQYKVSINSEGKFSGWAWSENVGWINFDSTQTWDVRACIVKLEDLQNFASYWLGSNVAADLYLDGTVNMEDLSIFASYWQDFCPDGWQLK